MRQCILSLLVVVCWVRPIYSEDRVDFDRQVAPLLAERCLDCHSGAAPEAKLDLTQKDSTWKGGDSGPALTTGKLDGSLLWQRVRDDEMPPKHPLTVSEKQLLKAWIEQGATWGTSPIDRFRYSSAKRAGYDWWALQPLQAKAAGPLPVDWESRATHPIDRYVLAKLHEQGLTPSEPALPRVLARRLAFDLIGLPPSENEVDQFAADPSAAAYDALLTKWLDAPQYGERWARHWLDLARYGESQGFERDKLRTNSWPYRDWVIRALNADMPYDEFVRQQLAGDLLQPGNAEAIIATGFLVAAPYDEVGQTQQSLAMRAVVRQDEIEDIVGTVGQTFLGLTVNCARCHDHKFDPISQVEYYQLAACLDGVRHGERKIETESQHTEIAQSESRVNAIRDDLAAIETPARERVLKRRTAGQKQPAPQPISRFEFAAEGHDSVGPLQSTLRPGAVLREGRLTLDGKQGFAISSPIPVRLKAKTLEAWVQLATLQQAGGGVIGVQTTDGNRFDSIVFAEREPNRWMAGSEGYARYQSFQGAEEAEAAQRMVHVALVYSEDGTIAAFRDGVPYGKPYDSGEVVVYEPGSAQLVFGLRHGVEAGGNRLLAGAIESAQLYDRALTADEIAASAGRTDFVSTTELLAAMNESERARREQLLAEQKQRNERLQQLRNVTVYACTPRPPGVTKLLIRGNPGTPADPVVPRGMAALTTLSSDFGLAPDAPDDQRRLALARWITAKENPLFARVMVNRVWQYHFGVGLVDSPNDFGFNGGRPTHPELLDFLAQWLIDNEWSLKKLHRLILTSRTWQQSSQPRSDAQTKDAENRWLWRFRPHRLEAETIRDAQLAVSGLLNPQVGGPPYQDFRTFTFNSQFFEMIDPETPDAHRRTIYRTWIRSGRSSLLDALDCPDPSTTAPRRAVTTTPVQSLALLNNSFVLRMADATAKRLEQEFGPEARLEQLWQRAYARSITDNERQQVAPFVDKHGLSALCRVVFNSNEFVYVE